MRQNYFLYQGVRYYSGTTIIVKENDKISRRVFNTKATFIYYDTERDKYAFSINGCTNIYPKQDFDRVFVGVTEDVVCKQDANDLMNKWIHTQENKKHTLTEELSVEGMFVAWVWYVFIMAVAIIFNDRIGIWLFASIIFFNYRKKKLKEAGLKK
jgi:hypothetical protein